MDSYPYAAISAFALHPLYLNLDRLAGTENRALPEELGRSAQQLNALDTVDYEAVMKAKLAFRAEDFPGATRGNVGRRGVSEIFRAKRTLARAVRGVLFFARQVRHGGFQPMAGTSRL